MRSLNALDFGATGGGGFLDSADADSAEEGMGAGAGSAWVNGLLSLIAEGGERTSSEALGASAGMTTGGGCGFEIAGTGGAKSSSLDTDCCSGSGSGSGSLDTAMGAAAG